MYIKLKLIIFKKGLIIINSSINEFYQEVSSDEALQKKFLKLMDCINTNLSKKALIEIIDNNIIPAAKERGFNFTTDELLEYELGLFSKELDDKCLSEISGGGFLAFFLIGLLGLSGVGNSIANVTPQLNSTDVALPANFQFAQNPIVPYVPADQVCLVDQGVNKQDTCPANLSKLLLKQDSTSSTSKHHKTHANKRGSKNKSASTKSEIISVDSIYEEGLRAEPIITDHLKRIVKKNRVNLTGLNFRLKSKESYLRKVESDKRDEMNLGKSTEEVAKNIHDVVRYTVILPQEKFGEKFLAVKNDLTKTGYRFLKLKNTWLDSASSYKGVNAQLLTPEGYIFELQFHTQQSFEVKEDTHKFYEEWRAIGTTDQRKLELLEKMKELSSNLQKPQDVDKINNIKGVL